MGLLQNPSWRVVLQNLNKFGDHVREDPAIWSVVVITGGTMIWGTATSLRKYWYEPDRK